MINVVAVSSVVVWGWEDFIAEAEWQLGAITVYKDVVFKEKIILKDLAKTTLKNKVESQKNNVVFYDWS